MRVRRILSLVVAGALAAAGLSACTKQADTVNKNIANEGDSFNILRRVVFINGITDNYILTIEGWCSVDLSDAARYSVTCKVGKDSKGKDVFKRDFLGKSDNVTMLVEQLEPKNVSANHYELILRPASIIPQPVIQ